MFYIHVFFISSEKEWQYSPDSVCKMYYSMQHQSKQTRLARGGTNKIMLLVFNCTMHAAAANNNHQADWLDFPPIKCFFQQQNFLLTNYHPS